MPKSGDVCFSSSSCVGTGGIEGSGYTVAAMKCNSTYGAWYNYSAATAETITSYHNSNEATSSICPGGWRLFSKSERVITADFKNRFDPVIGGRYYNGDISTETNGYWWSSTSDSSNDSQRHILAYHGSDNKLGMSTVSRYNGAYIRCVHD